MLNPSDVPLLLPQDVIGTGTATIYDGYLSIKDEDYRFKITVPQDNDLSNATIEAEWKLQVIIDEYQTIINQRLSQCKDLGVFLNELIMIMENELKAEDISYTNSNLTHHIVGELEKIGWDKLKSIDARFENVVLEILDSKDRKHFLKVLFNIQNVDGEPKCMTDLPDKFMYHWNQEEGLKGLLNQFEESLKLYEEFWDEMEQLDKNTWILEPEQPRYSSTHRRIVIAPNASLQIDVDARQPRNFPECIFLGADQLVNPLKEKLNQNLHRWVVNKSLLNNLEAVLDITFPSPTNSNKEDFSVECGICYAYRLELATPDIVCDDKRCGQAFHQHCLYEWLRSLPSSRQSFNTIYGECPFCSKAITVKMPMS